MHSSHNSLFKYEEKSNQKFLGEQAEDEAKISMSHVPADNYNHHQHLSLSASPSFAGTHLPQPLLLLKILLNPHNPQGKQVICSSILVPAKAQLARNNRKIWSKNNRMNTIGRKRMCH